VNYKVTESDGLKYIECVSGDVLFTDESDALEAVVFCHENNTNMLLLFAECISDDFFKLSTGLAGAIIQKLVNYGVQTALVASDEIVNQGKFSEMVSEANRGRQFRTFPNRIDAERWFVDNR